MDYYPLDNTPTLFSSLPQTSYDVPSFDEAFDTKSLKDFYRQQSHPNIFASKCQRELSNEEEFRSQTFEAPSPATTVQSHSFFDMFGGSHYEDFRNEGPFGSNQNSNKTLQNYMSPLRMRQAQVAKGIHLNFGLENHEKPMEKEPEVQKNKPEENLIAMLCEQMKQYYGENPGAQNERQGFFQQNQQPRNVIMKNMDERNLMFNEEDKLTGTIVRKLISKKKIFEIQRSKKGLEGNLRKGSVVVESNVLKEIKKRTISVELTTTSLFKSESLVKKDEEKKEKKPRKRNTDNGEKKEKKEKKEKTEKKTVPATPQLNVQIGNNGADNSVNSANAKKVVFGNITTGMKDFGSYQMFSS